MKSKSPLRSLVILLAALTPALHAATVITPTGATSISTVGGDRIIDRTIDGSGLVDGGDPLSELDDTHVYGAGSNIWLSVSGAVDDDSNFRRTTEVLEFDLGGAHDINTVYYWSYTRDYLRNLKTFDISYSTDGGSSFTIPVSAASLGMADWGIQNNVRDPSTVETRTFSALSGVTDIRFSNISNHGDINYLALGEIRFGAVPEPSAALLGGLGALMLLRRRRS